MGLLAPLITFLAVPLFLAAFAWYARRARRTAASQSLMGPLEEIWDPIAYQTNIEIRIEGERTPETPAPGDPPTLTRLLERGRKDAG